MWILFLAIGLLVLSRTSGNPLQSLIAKLGTTNSALANQQTQDVSKSPPFWATLSDIAFSLGGVPPTGAKTSSGGAGSGSGKTGGKHHV